MNRLQSHENAPNSPKFSVNSPAINRKFVKIGSHFHGISLRFPNYQTRSKTHLRLAQDLNRPINIHIRKAWDALIHILKKNGTIQSGGLIHSFSGSADLARVLETYNLHISFSGAVTRPNAKKVVGALNTVSLDRIVFETDTPDIYPSFNGIKNPSQHLNSPANLYGIVKIAAQRRGMAFETLADLGFRNALDLFSPIIQPDKRE